MFQTAGLAAQVDRKKGLDLAVKLSRYIEKKGVTILLEEFYRRIRGLFFLGGKGAEV